MSAAARKLSITLLLAIFLLCVYRARTQSLTVDEAWVFQLFVSKKLVVMAQQYDACNHVLHTLLMKLLRGILGASELVLRLPSLLGAALYLTGLFRLTRLTLGPWEQLLALAVLTLHPLVLDLMIAARGYGLALGLLTWALYCAVSYHVRGFDPKWLRRAGVLAGLAIAANLTFLVPAAALGLILLLMAGPEGMWRVIDSYAGPAVVVSFLIVVIPLLPAERSNFYFGASTFLESVRSVAETAIKVPGRWPDAWLQGALPALSSIVIPALLALLSFASAVLLVRYIRVGKSGYKLAPFLLTAGTLAGSITLVVLLNQLTGTPYPRSRTGVYLIPLFLLSGFLAIRLLPPLRWPVYAGAALLTAMFMAQTDNRYFLEWSFDASTEELLRRMETDYGPRVVPNVPPKVGGSWVLKPSADYYRMRRNLPWITEVVTTNLESTPLDYYLLAFEDRALVDRLGLHVIYRDQLSGSVLARSTP